MNAVPHAYKKDVYVLLVEEEPWKEVHTAIFGHPPSLEAFSPSESRFLEIEKTRVKQYVLKQLAKRSFSSYELRQRLTDCLVSLNTAEAVLMECMELGYIHDADWLKHFIAAQLAKKQGPRSILAKLRKKGVPEELCRAALAAVQTEEGQEESLRMWIQKKYGNRDLQDYKERQKVIGALLRRGFEYEEIMRQLHFQEDPP